MAEHPFTREQAEAAHKLTAMWILRSTDDHKLVWKELDERKRKVLLAQLLFAFFDRYYDDWPKHDDYTT